MTFGERIGARNALRARRLADAWEAAGLGPAIPAYASTVLHYDPAAHRPAEARGLARRLARRPAGRRPGSERVLEIPVRYDGPDLEDVARLSALSVAELVALHAGGDYFAYFIGFLPGFAYLGEVDPRIVAPRMDEPRARVPAGSVAVAGTQTGIYPLSSPGGWRLLGTTDAILFDARRDPPALIAPGDRVRFVPR